MYRGRRITTPRQMRKILGNIIGMPTEKLTGHDSLMSGSEAAPTPHCCVNRTEYEENCNIIKGIHTESGNYKNFEAD